MAIGALSARRRPTACGARRLLSVALFAALCASLTGACAPAPAASSGAAAAAPSTAAPADSSATAARVPVRMALATISSSVVPVVVARDRGFFERQGIDGELIVARSGAEAMAAQLSGDVPVVITGSNALINANAGGADLVAVAVNHARFTYQVMASNELQTPTDLRGKRLGIADVGGSSDLATLYLLKKYGLRRGEDTTVLALGSQNERLGGLMAGAVDAVMIQAPFTVAARKAGYHVLVDFANEDYEIPVSGVVVRRDWVRDHPDLVRKVVTALVDAIHYVKTDREGTIAVMGSFLKLDDREGLEDIYREFQGDAMPAVPYPRASAMVNALEEVSARNPSAAQLSPESLIDDRFVRELDESGYIRKLYGE